METLIVDNEHLDEIILTKDVRSVVPIDDQKSMVLFTDILVNDLIYDLNATVQSEMSSSILQVKSNVAIAAAITAYARNEMMKYKLNDAICYTDTDSIFTTEKLSDDLVGGGLWGCEAGAAPASTISRI